MKANESTDFRSSFSILRNSYLKPRKVCYNICYACNNIYLDCRNVLFNAIISARIIWLFASQPNYSFGNLNLNCFFVVVESNEVEVTGNNFSSHTKLSMATVFFYILERFNVNHVVLFIQNKNKKTKKFEIN